MSRRIAVVHEAEADFDTATELADRVLVEAIDWLDEHLIANQREWVAQEPGGRRLTWRSIPQLARAVSIRAHGHFGGVPGEPDAAAARRAIMYLLVTIPELEAILLIRDQDDQPERRDGLEQARGHDRTGMVIVIGLAVVEREAWVICGFDPADDDEKQKLEDERQNLGLDPRDRSHELTACKNNLAKRSPKRVLRALSGGDADRERRCWRETTLATLRDRGAENGLVGFLHEVNDKLARLIGHVS